jgi:putative toxin-antitoxin system antitoxin component (TIGR02293 family)
MEQNLNNRTKVVKFGGNVCVMNYSFSNQASTAVNEAAAAYLNASGSKGHGYTFIDFLQDKMLVVHSIQRGITQAFFEAIKSRMPFSDQEWADFFNISLKSLQRYKNDKNHVYKPILSEKIIQTAEVVEEGRRVFGSDEKFFRWLDTPSFALGGVKPKELLRDAYGQSLVMAELNAIDHGIFA